jgi:hypothetical protein
LARDRVSVCSQAYRSGLTDIYLAEQIVARSFCTSTLLAVDGAAWSQQRTQQLGTDNSVVLVDDKPDFDAVQDAIGRRRCSWDERSQESDRWGIARAGMVLKVVCHRENPCFTEAPRSDDVDRTRPAISKITGG